MRTTTTFRNAMARRLTRGLLVGLALFTPWLAHCGSVHAANITWNVAGGGDWDTTTANWTGDSTFYTDGNVDNVTFNNTAGGIINLTADRAPGSTTFSAASGTYTISGSNITSGDMVLSSVGTVVMNSQWTAGTNVTIGGGGTLRLGASERLADTVNLLGNGTFDMNGFNETIRILNGGYAITNMGILTVKSGFDRSGGPISGVGGRFVNDTGANFGVILSAGGHTYSGGTEVKTGTMYLYGTTNVLPMTGELEVKTGATMSLNYHQGSGITQTIGILQGGGNILSGNTNAVTADTLFRVGNGGGSSTYSGVYSGFGKLEKIGGGTLTLNGNNTYTGTTTVTAGTLLVNGTTGAGQGNYLVSSGATLGGSGTINLAGGNSVTVANGGNLAPGNSAGTLTINGNLILNNTTNLNFELGNPAVFSASDHVVVNGDLTLDGVLNVTKLPGFVGGVYQLFSYTGTFTNNGLVISDPELLLNLDTPGLVLLTFTPVPEPSTLALVGLSIVALAVRRRCRAA